MANVLKAETQKTILRLLLEGNSIRSVVRLTGCHKKTVTRLMVRFGDACREFLDETMRGLTLDHVQCDEIWTFVQKKQARLTTEERATRHDIGDIYLWVAFDQNTKLVPTFAIGKRSADNARRFMVDLRNRLETPAPHESDRHAYVDGNYRYVTQISTDAFQGYSEAVDIAFGPYVKYGQLVKDFRNADRKPGNYSPAEIVATERRGVFGIHENELDSICTSHVERNNLTIRTFMKRFARLSLGFSKKLENLAAAVAMYVAYYNYCWRSRYPDNSGRRGQLRPTAAMMAGVTERLWSFDDLFNAVDLP